jgi:hypothetical protein
MEHGMTINETFLQNYKILESDLDVLYNHLLEIEIPLNKTELTKVLFTKLIEQQKYLIQSERLSNGEIYFPKNKYSPGQSLIFPHMGWKKGKVKSVRPGISPENPALEVVEIEFSDTTRINMASNLEDHVLNNPPIDDNDSFLNLQTIIAKFGQVISTQLEQILSTNSDLVCIAGSYFPRSLLVDVSVGHLNLCEAVLEIEGGGPLTSKALISQVELPTDVNANLTEFSLNLALQEDSRFDEVGPSGETLWFLKRFEPVEVQATPLTLKYLGEKIILPSDLDQYQSLGSEICDELEPDCDFDSLDEVTVSLTYPHWRAGTLPLTSKLKQLFPTAHEAPRIKFDFIENKSNTTFPGWVVRPSKYIFGLREWYVKEGFIPGSLITISRSKNPGEVFVNAQKLRNMKDWIRTVLVGADGGIVFALLKQVVTCTFDERLAIVVPDVTAIDQIWENSKPKQSIEKSIQNIMRELAKLNPQGHIHAQEIYAAVNVVRRCPPSLLVSVLFSQPWSLHLGNLYFRINEI